MPSFSSRGLQALIFTSAAVFSLAIGVEGAYAVGASGAPLLDMILTVDDGDPLSLNPGVGTALGGGTYNFTSSFAGGSDYSVNWNLNVNADPFVNGNMAATNLSLSNLVFDLMVILPVTPIASATVIGGSAQLTLTTSSAGGSVSTFGSQAGWEALMDGAVVHTFFAAPFSMTNPGLGSTLSAPQSFGTPIPSAAGPPVASTIGVHLRFMLTPGSAFSITSVFVVDVPGPASLAVLAGGLLIRRRRRG